MAYPIYLKENGVIVFSKVFATEQERTNYINVLQDKFTYETDAGGIEEAPIDGKTYGRKDADWSEVIATGGGDVLLATEYNASAAGGILICSEYDVSA